MPRELFVEKGVVRRQQIDDAAILFQLSIEKQLHFPDECDSQVVVEPGKLLVEIRREQPDISCLQPFLEEVLHQRGACMLVTQHAPDLSIEHSRLVQRSADRRVEQFVVGDAAPQEKRQARRQLDIRQGVRGAGGGDVRLGLNPEQEIGAHEKPLDPCTNPGVEISLLPCDLIEIHERLDVVVRQGAAIGASRQRRQNFRRARGLLTAAGGLADEEPPPAGRVR